MKFKGQVSALVKWLSTFAVGLLGNWMMKWTFELILYPFVIYKCGVLWGGLIMIVLSFFICYATILFYDWAKRDWIGIEVLKGIKESKTDSVIGRLISKIVKKSDPVAMVFLSIKFDPFITVAYMRHGAHKYNGLSERDWKIFITSLTIGNIYWISAVYLGITVIGSIWRLIF